MGREQLMTILIYFLALVAALTAVAKNRGQNQKPLPRKPYILSMGMLLVPLILLGVYDIVRLEVETLPALGETVNLVLPIYLLATAYPVFQRISLRAADANMSRFWVYFSLIPYLNLFVILALAVLPSRRTGSLGSSLS